MVRVYNIRSAVAIKHGHCILNSLVSGFEAYIGEKHIIGQLKKKEEARREYRQAVAAGHGAYLMEQEEPVTKGQFLH